MSSLILIIVLLFLSVQFSMLMVKNHTIALIYTSLMTNKVDHIFIFSSTIWIALLVSYLFEIFFFYPIFYWIVSLANWFKFFKYPECPNIF